MHHGRADYRAWYRWKACLKSFLTVLESRGSVPVVPISDLFRTIENIKNRAKNKLFRKLFTLNFYTAATPDIESYTIGKLV